MRTVRGRHGYAAPTQAASATSPWATQLASALIDHPSARHVRHGDCNQLVRLAPATRWRCSDVREGPCRLPDRHPALRPAVRAQASQTHSSQSAAVSPAPAKRPNLARVGQLIIEQTNQFRHKHGRPPLHRNAKLAKSAGAFAAYLARTGTFSHTADGRQPWDRAAAQDYAACIVAENIAWEKDTAGYTTRGLAEALMHGWEKSPPHRKNLLDPDLVEIGVGVAYSPKTGRYYGVQDFGRPKADAIVFTIADDASSAVGYTLGGKQYTIEPRYTVTQERCRPATLTFNLPGATGTPTTYHPHTGSHYIIRTDAEGHYTVTEE